MQYRVSGETYSIYSAKKMSDKPTVYYSEPLQLRFFKRGEMTKFEDGVKYHDSEVVLLPDDDDCLRSVHLAKKMMGGRVVKLKKGEYEWQ